MQYIPLSKLYYSDTDHYDTIYLQRFNSESAYRFSFESCGCISVGNKNKFKRPL